MNRRTSNCIKWLLGAGVALIVVGLAGRAFSADVSACTTSWEAMSARLAVTYGELPVLSWVEAWKKSDGQEYKLVKTLFVNEAADTWTMVFNGVEGATCTMRNGTGVALYGLGEAS